MRAGHRAVPRRSRRQVGDAGDAPVELAIVHLGDGGDGIAETPAGRVYVPFTVPGDRVRARLGAPRGDGRGAELMSVVETGPGRSQPPCPHFGVCGGCALQHLDDDVYARWKVGRLVRALERAGLDAGTIEPLARTGTGARRRASFTVRRSGDAVVAGFLRRSSNAVVDVVACPVLDARLVAILPAVRRLLPERGDPGAAVVAATVVEDGLDLVVEFPATPNLGMRERLAAFAREAGAGRVSWRPTALAEAETIAQHRPVGAKFGGVFVPVPAGGFLQATAEGERVLVEAVVSAMTGALRVADLFAGAGTFALPLAAAGARVHALDADAASLAALAAASRSRPALAGRLTCERRDLFLRPMTAAELKGRDVVVFDPPRAGAAAQAAELARSDAALIVAVSCNPATFARDARILADGGWRLRRVLPVDQFLWSPHLELVATFTRANK